MLKFEETNFNKDQLKELKLVLEKNIVVLKNKIKQTKGYEKKLNKTFLDAELQELKEVEKQLKKA